jgi:hypothetical protein
MPALSLSILPDSVPTDREAGAESGKAAAQSRFRCIAIKFDLLRGVNEVGKRVVFYPPEGFLRAYSHAIITQKGIV